MNPASEADQPPVIGLLGGIAAGKSHVARLFADHGFVVLDADAAARAVVADPAIRERIAARFGAGVLAPGGELDRAALAEIVFTDAGARRDLEAITHPAVRQRLEAGLESARRDGRPVVLDVPLLLEGGLIERCDHCVFLDAPDAVRAARARERGWDADELRKREAAQAPLATKRTRCRFTVPTGGDPEVTRAAVTAIVATVTTTKRPGPGH